MLRVCSMIYHVFVDFGLFSLRIVLTTFLYVLKYIVRFIFCVLLLTLTDQLRQFPLPMVYHPVFKAKNTFYLVGLKIVRLSTGNDITSRY